MAGGGVVDKTPAKSGEVTSSVRLTPLIQSSKPTASVGKKSRILKQKPHVSGRKD